MAKCVITIEDVGSDKVRIEAVPNVETVMAMDISGSKLTSAHGYMMKMLNVARDVSKENGPINYKIPIIGH